MRENAGKTCLYMYTASPHHTIHTHIVFTKREKNFSKLIFFLDAPISLLRRLEETIKTISFFFLTRLPMMVLLNRSSRFYQSAVPVAPFVVAVVFVWQRGYRIGRDARTDRVATQFAQMHIWLAENTDEQTRLKKKKKME